MILRTRGGGEKRIFEMPPIPRFASGYGGFTSAGVLLTQEAALGLPAVAAAVSLISEAIASLNLVVFKGRLAQKRPADGSWQAKLLKKPVGDERTPFDFVSDVVASIEVSGNAYLHKVKSEGKIVVLRVLNPQRVEVRRDEKTGDKVFRIAVEPGRWETFSVAEILHIRGLTIDGGDEGLSPIALHRESLGRMVAQERYSQETFANQAVPPGFISVPGNPNQDDADKMRQKMLERYSDPVMRKVPGVLTNGATWVNSGMSNEDAQFVESQKLSVTDVARIFRLPKSWLGEDVSGEGAAEQDSLRFYQALHPRIRRIEWGFLSDTDFFPTDNPYLEFDVSELLRTDAKTSAEVEHIRVQDGTLLVDEARAQRGLAPLPPIPEDPSKTPGAVPQLTPVGGAPNPQTNGSGDPAAVPTP